MQTSKWKLLLGKKISRIFLIVWPSQGVKETSMLDVSLGLVLDNAYEDLWMVTTDIQDGWSPLLQCLDIKAIPRIYDHHSYDTRVKGWMHSTITDELNNEFFDFSQSHFFKNICSKEIVNVELISLEENPMPFGVKIACENDYIMSLSSANGNTIETARFNKHHTLQNFQHLGKITFTKVVFSD